MYTEILKIDADNPEKELISKAASYLKEGGLCVFPTETVYGLGANALLPLAVKNIYSSKGRPHDNPLIMHVSDYAMINEFTSNIPEKAVHLIEKFMPGPLTIILQKNDKIPNEVTAGLDTVAVRMPGNTISLALIEECGFPVAAPSANISGRPSPTSVEHVVDDLYGRIECIIDGGPTNIGIESTVIDMTEEIPILLRPGNITLRMLETEIGIINLPNKFIIPRSPGLKYKHYSPNATVLLVDNQNELVELANTFKSSGKKVGLLTDEATDDFKHTYFYNSKEELAKNLFAIFRKMDKEHIDVIIVKKVDEEGIGSAIMNRLEKSATK